jgi:hypothetical protein
MHEEVSAMTLFAQMSILGEYVGGNKKPLQNLHPCSMHGQHAYKILANWVGR